jgi:23S rRNA (guanine2445-N2)-methyltransferase / 23S rRNA (guanine2069-N7)-methyltransferase
VSTTSVDLSRVYLEWADRNLDLNGLSGPQHRFVRADCLEWLSEATAGRRGEARPGPATRNVEARGRGAGQVGGAGPVFDLIFMDPPTFSNSKSMEGTLDIQRDHPWLIRSAMTLLAPGGILLFSTNFRRFKLDGALSEELAVTDVTRRTIPPDFARNPRIHSCFRIERPPAGTSDAGGWHGR